ncbi:MAG TPA: HEAT repeat domain-containing protein, partial [Acidimicrobiales bacterium]|nr:HEAT repeat domain-containing protein [Acidimicrobiales bacterium]
MEESRGKYNNDTSELRRIEASSAGFTGDEQTARRLTDDAVAKVRAAAFAALVRLGAATPDDIRRALSDPSPIVRRGACELARSLSGTAFDALLDDIDASVVEAAAFAVGETGDRRATKRLAEIASTHSDPLCRESAVAALGSLGDPAGKAAVLAALDDVATVRRRAVIA